jgi:tetratricopeptide (TPR) repeat protein
MAKKDSFFVTSGPVGRNSQSYVERQADTDLYNALCESKFCYVLTPRQMGKSSLVVRTSARLKQEGGAVAVVDLTIIGQSVSAEQWYRSILRNIGEQFNLENEVLEFWRSHSDIGALDRLMQALQKVVLKHLDVPITIFIDEVDYVRSMSFSTGEFFAAIRALYIKRVMDKNLERLTFCLLGVTSLSDLIEDKETTPFNIGEQIELTDFKEHEAAPLIKGLGYREELGTVLLHRIIYWTGGHPYLTQSLCEAVSEDPNVATVKDVDRVCKSLFLSNNARISDKNLIFVRDSILESKSDRASLLDLYGRVHGQTDFVNRLGDVFSSRMARVYRFLRGYTQVRDDETNPLVTVLRLSGITRVVGDELAVRNRIYYTVFDKRWISANMPSQEKTRQRAAFIRGAIRIGGIAAIALLIVGSLALAAYRGQQEAQAAHTKTELALEEAKKQQAIAEAEKAEAQKQKRRADEEAKGAEEARAKAVAAQKLAEIQKGEADKQRQIAETQRGEALRRKAEADSALKEADLRLQTVTAYQNGVDQYFKGNQEAAITNFSNALKLYDEQISRDKLKRKAKEDLYGKAVTYTNIAAAYEAKEAPEQALEKYNEALKIYHDNLKDPSGEAYAHMKKGEIGLELKYGPTELRRRLDADEKVEEEEGFKELLSAKQIYTESHNQSGLAQVLTTIAETYSSFTKNTFSREKLSYSDIKKSVDAYNEAILAYQEDNDLSGEIESLDKILSLLDKVRSSGNDINRNEYVHYLRELKEAYSQRGLIGEMNSTQIKFITESNKLGKEKEALSALMELLQDYQNRNVSPYAYQSLTKLAIDGDPEQREEIIKFLRQRLNYYEENKKYSEEIETFSNLGQIYFKTKDLGQALDCYNKALEVHPQNNDRSAVAQLARLAGYINYTLGDKQKALQLYTQAGDAYRQADDPNGEIDSLQYIAELYYSLGEKNKALEIFNQIIDLYLKRPEMTRSSFFFDYMDNRLVYSARAINDIYKEFGEKDKLAEFNHRLFHSIVKDDPNEYQLVQGALLSLYLGNKQEFSSYLADSFIKAKVKDSRSYDDLLFWLLAAGQKEQALKFIERRISNEATDSEDPYGSRGRFSLMLFLIGDDIRERGILDKMYQSYKARTDKGDAGTVSNYSDTFNVFGDRKRASELYLSIPPENTSTTTMNTNVPVNMNSNTSRTNKSNSSTNTSSSNTSSGP